MPLILPGWGSDPLRPSSLPRPLWQKTKCSLHLLCVLHVLLPLHNLLHQLVASFFHVCIFWWHLFNLCLFMSSSSLMLSCQHYSSQCWVVNILSFIRCAYYIFICTKLRRLCLLRCCFVMPHLYFLKSVFAVLALKQKPFCVRCCDCGLC